MNNMDFTDLLNQKRTDFIEHVKWLKRPDDSSKLMDTYTRNSTYPILNISDPESDKQDLYYKFLESSLRDLFINPVLMELFADNGFQVMPLNDDRVFFPPKSTKDHENYIGNIFEFIVKSDTVKFGVRFCEFFSELLEPIKNKLFTSNSEIKLDYIAIVHWCDNNSHEGRLYSALNDELPFIHHYTIEGFFKEFFSVDQFKMFLRSLQESLAEAKDVIGLHTIAQYTNENIDDIRKKIEYDFQHINYNRFEYLPIDPSSNSISLNEQDFSNIYSHFTTHQLYKILTGKSDVAKSYMTSCYLMSVFDGKGEFDYTAIVAGYLKSVELLLYRIALTHIDKPNILIKKNPKLKKDVEGEQPDRNNKKIYNVPFTTVNKDNDCFDTTLGSLVYFFKNNKNLLKISVLGKRSFTQALSKYTHECRNGNFHKHVISDWDIVMKIYNNTIFIITVLLGSSFDEVIRNADSFDMIDNTFDIIYKSIISAPSAGKNYIFEYEDGKKVKVMKLFKQDSAVYDKFGTLTDSRILFAVVTDFSSSEWDRINTVTDSSLDVIVLTKDSLPKHIWRVVGNERRQIL